MKWERESWRKLYTRVTPAWAKLPFLVRATGTELLKYADDDGRIPIDDGDPMDEIQRLLAVRPDESPLFLSAIAALLDAELLHVKADHFAIPDFAQHRAPRSEAGWSRSAYPEVYERDGRICRYCGAHDVRLSIDHVIPRARGGDDSAANLVVACRPCNGRKWAKTPEEAGMSLLPITVVFQ